MKQLVLLTTTFPLLLLLLPLAGLAGSPPTTGQRLFHLERNKNTNIVVYDAIVAEDGSLDEKNPVSVYWIKAAEDGRLEKLKSIERKKAYGFKVKEREGDRVTLQMKADIGRPIFVDHHEDGFAAFVEIDGRESILERIYVFADESGTLPKVLYIELFGHAIEDGEETYEKLEG